MGRLGTSAALEMLLRGVKPRAWRSGWAGRMFGPATVRVVAVTRSDLPEVREVASRILGGPAYAAFKNHEGTVYGRVATLEADTGFRLERTTHEGCLACYSHIFAATAHAAATGSVGATYGSAADRFIPSREGGTRWDDPDGVLVREVHEVTVKRSGQ